MTVRGAGRAAHGTGRRRSHRATGGATLVALLATLFVVGCSVDPEPVTLALVASADAGPIEVTTVVDGESAVEVLDGAGFRREVDVDGGFDVEIRVVSHDGAEVGCVIEGLDQPREVRVNPSLGGDDRVSLSGEPRVQGHGGVRCAASGHIEGGAANYRSETEVFDP